jgi:hypothetical protein
MYAQITSSLTVGLGGSAGLELLWRVPLFGSNYAQRYKLSYKTERYLLVVESLLE